jgi:hypothetical protein
MKRELIYSNNKIFGVKINLKTDNNYPREHLAIMYLDGIIGLRTDISLHQTENMHRFTAYRRVDSGWKAIITPSCFYQKSFLEESSLEGKALNELINQPILEKFRIKLNHHLYGSPFKREKDQTQ